ncbi:MAG: hypothetical protein AMXMBFR83_16280 [Phycisphaerae bacterium]
MYRTNSVIGLAGGVLVLFAPFVQADITSSYNFVRLTDNGNGVDLGSQLLMEVTGTSVSATEAIFKFSNNVGIASSITQIYFDDGSVLSSLLSITDSGAGVAFDDPATPGNLPSGNTAVPAFSADFSGGADAPVSANGVNSSSEWVAFKFSLVGDYDDVIAALASGVLRVGLHVQSIGTVGKSDSYLNGDKLTPNTIPAPGALLLVLVGLAGIGRMRVRPA